MKYNTITKQAAAKVPAGVYEGIDYHGEPPADVAARAGWVDVTPEIQAVIDQQAADAAAAQAKAAADQAKADAEAQAKFAAEEDARIMALPSVAALKARLATNEAAVVKLSADVAAKVTPK